MGTEEPSILALIGMVQALTPHEIGGCQQGQLPGRRRMSRICIGLRVHAEPGRLHTTLNSLSAHTTQTVSLLLLPDGPDETTRAVLAALRALPQLGTEEPLGAPACFNRLAASTDADIVVLLES